MNIERFPVYKFDYIFNKFEGNLKNKVKLLYKEIEISYPCRLDAMAINPSAVCYNDDMIFTPGEVVISTKKYIKVSVRVINEKNTIKCGIDTKRKVLVKHAYSLIKKVLNFEEGLEINVIDDDIPKHCGFGSSSSTIAAVSAAINEMYNHPIDNNDLIKYLASNHGEEISDDNEDELKMVQCIGGGATNGLTEDGITIIAGKSTPICSMKYEGEIIIGIPENFEIKDANYLMKKEEENLWKFKQTGDKFSNIIAYNLLHKALPAMKNNSIKELADVVFEYRFNMGSIENCSFVHENMIEEGKQLRKLYEKGLCDFLALSSVGPAYFVIVKDKDKKEKCIEKFKKIGMRVMETSICNEIYRVDKKENNNKIFWEDENTAKLFSERPCSKYIIDAIDNIIKENSRCIDIGCGGGRYSRYLKSKNINVIALDKYSNMATSLSKDNIEFIQSCFDNIAYSNESFDYVLSIGVLHNAVTPIEFKKGVDEIYRILKQNGKAIVSIFTNDIITSDLTQLSENCYSIKERPSMVLYSEEEINNIFINVGFSIEKIIDKHITDVGNHGARYVYSFIVKKQ